LPRSLEEKLNKFFLSDKPSFSAHLYVANQKKVRELLSDKWSKIVPMLEVKIGKLLSDRMTWDDILVRKDVFSYYVISIDRGGAEAKTHFERLAAQIFEQIFKKDPLLQELQISGSAFKVSTDVVSTMAELKNYLFHHDDSEGATISIGRHNYASRLPEQINNKLVRQVVGLRTACDNFFIAANPLPDENEDLQPYRSKLVRIAEATKIVNDSIAELLGSGSEALSVPEATAEPPAETEEKNDKQLDELHAIVGDHSEIVYFPIWDVDKQLVNNYRCTLVQHLPSGISELNTGSATHIAPYKIDQLIAEKVGSDNLADQNQDDASFFVMPLHVNTLQNKEQFLKIELRLKSLSMLQRKQLKIEIIGATRNTTYEAIKNLVAKIKVYCNSVSFRLSMDMKISPSLRKIGVSSIGFHISDLSIVGKDVTQAIEEIAISSDKLNIDSFVYGVDTIADAAAAIGSGVNYISGQAVGDALDVPWGTLPFEVENLYARLLSS